MINLKEVELRCVRDKNRCRKNEIWEQLTNYSVRIGSYFIPHDSHLLIKAIENIFYLIYNSYYIAMTIQLINGKLQLIALQPSLKK